MYRRFGNACGNIFKISRGKEKGAAEAAKTKAPASLGLTGAKL
jgi:hypothetical protein